MAPAHRRGSGTDCMKSAESMSERFPATQSQKNRRRSSPTTSAAIFHVALLANPDKSVGQVQIKEVTEAAHAIGQKLIVFDGGSDDKIEAAFAALAPQHVSALLVGADPFFDTRRDRLVALALQHRMPAIYQFREYAVAGGLMSYGTSITEMYRLVGIYVGRILKGEKPADLPVLQVTKFELVINLKTARSLGVKISDNLLSIADEVIE